ncbi:MAG TPA: NAD(P)-dependent oxidoreductase [Solirubrobacteraceae bacterium]|nr:NAD(P)-dependent oxidoreductase [Solirubrobacteraceae bacterium]
MTRTLVTGGAGRLGRSVVQVLARAGRDVVSVDRDVVEGLPAVQIEMDLLDADARRALFADQRPDEVVHLAAIPAPFLAPGDETFAINTSLAYGVIGGALETGARSALVATSPTVVGYGSPGGWAPAYLPIDEEHPLAPWNDYALSKQAIELLVAVTARASGDRIRIGAFRPCYVVAPEEWEGAITQQGHTVLERLERPELASVALFNYVDARDAGEFVLAWLERADGIPNGTVFFVGAGDSLVRGPVADALAEWVPEAAEAAAPLLADAPVFSSALAERLLGWRARRSWRTEMSGSDTAGASEEVGVG